MQKTINITTEVPKLEAKGDYAGIIKLFKNVQMQVPLTERKDHQAIHMNLARANQAMRNYTEAQAEYTKAFNLIQDPSLLYLIGITQLHNRNFLEGFRNYGHRWWSGEMQPYYHALRSKGIPYVVNWNELTGKRVLVTGEQGFGDEIMFGRVIAPASKVASVIVRIVPEELADLFANSDKPANLTVKKLSMLPPEFIQENFDCIITVGDLFTLYVLEHGSLPSMQRYVAPNPVYTPGVRRKVGFVYSPGNMSDTSIIRAVNPKMFRRFELSYDMYSFQLGAPCIVGKDLSHHIHNFADSADLLDGMDCTITCDTSFAHLSLCMEKPTMVVYDRYLDWRFKVGLYPNAVLLSTLDRDFERRVRNFIECAVNTNP